MNYMIGGAFARSKAIQLFILKNRNRINSHNITVYDGINKCAWNGGRVNRDVYYDEKITNFYYNNNISIALTFSNPVIDLSDIVGNKLLKLFHKENNAIILVNDRLRDYIRTKYPRYRLIYSITGMGEVNVPIQDSDIRFYKSLESRFDLIVPRMEHVFDERFQTELNMSKYEIMLNDTCIWNCSKYKEHFDSIALQNTLNNNYNEKTKEIEECWIKGFDPFKDSSYKCMDIKDSDFKELTRLGISHFKICGREMEDTELYEELERFMI